MNGDAIVDPVPETVTALRDRFAADGFDDQIPRGEPAKMLVRFRTLYSSKGLLREGRPAALCDVCANKNECWPKDAGKTRRRPKPKRSLEDNENGGVFLPWIGPKYEAGGVVVLAINPNVAANDDTDLLIEHAITWDWHVDGLRQGKVSNANSRFAFGAMRSAAALLDAIAGEPVKDRRKPEELADAVRRTARLQAIKCIPRRVNSEPYSAMWDHCPSLLLRDELNILRPRKLLVLGKDPAKAVRNINGFDAKSKPGTDFGIGTLRRRLWEADVYALPHPRASTASAAQTRFAKALRLLQKN
jgi:hypothetical protein